MLLGLTSAAILLLFTHDALAIVTIWWTSSTFGHCLFVAPLVGWLVWLRRDVLATLAPSTWLPGIAIVAAGAGGWLVGEAAGVALARHAGLLMMIEGAVAALLGRRVAAALLFPLGYAWFLVPFGEFLEPPLQTLTARLCLGLLHLSQVPARIDGIYLTVPGGWFRVAEACSGAKFLIAMIAYGALVAHLGFRGWWRRALFMAACVVVPVLANGVRAWGTIMIARFVDSRFAESFDHVVYGWVFFGLVMAVLIGGAWRFFDRGADEPVAIPAARPSGADRPMLAGVLVLAIAAAPVMWSGAVAASADPLPDRIALPAVPGWTRVPLDRIAPWGPRFEHPDHSLLGRYRDAAGHEIDLAIVAFAAQDDTRGLVGYGRGAVGPDDDWAWTADLPAPAGGRRMRIVAPGRLVRQVAVFYRVGDRLTGSDAAVKLETLRVRLLGGRQRAAALFVSAREPRAGAAVDAFLRALGPVDRVIDRTLG